MERLRAASKWSMMQEEVAHIIVFFQIQVLVKCNHIGILYEMTFSSHGRGDALQPSEHPFPLD